MDKLSKLPDPTGSLSMKVLLSSIVLANAGVKNVLDESVAEGKQGCYVGKCAAEHGASAIIASQISS